MKPNHKLKESKICVYCGEEKALNEFYSRLHRGCFRYSRMCLECHCASSRKYYKENRHLWIKYRHDNRMKYRQAGKTYSFKLKEKAILAYGGICSCCGEANMEFLTIEHGWHDGKEHRERVGNHVYGDLKKRGFPKNIGITVLCWNCNMATRYGEVCPHKE